MDNYIKLENSLRRDAYRKDSNNELFLARCNEALRASPLPPESRERRDLPFVFVIGPPRSGTTLAMQLLVHCFRLGYVDNLMARFWEVPIHGARLSRIVLPVCRTASFSSEYGVTPLLTDPHEFGYFWSSWLGSRDQVKNTEQVDWGQLCSTLCLLAGEFAFPVAFKNLLLNHHVEGLAASLPSSLFIRIKRHPLDNAISILRAREAYYGDRNCWWSLRTGWHKGIEDRCWTEQIASQLATLQRMLDDSLSLVKEHSSVAVVEFDYEHICNAPELFLEQVQHACTRLGAVLDKTNPAPSLSPRRGLTCEEQDRLQAALCKEGLLEGAV